MFSKGGRVQTPKVCFFFRRGICKYGERCKFQHVKAVSEQWKKPEQSPYDSYKLKHLPDAGTRKGSQSGDESIRGAETQVQDVAVGVMEPKEGIEKKVTVASVASTVTLVDVYQSTLHLKQEIVDKDDETTRISKPAKSSSEKRTRGSVTTDLNSPAQEEAGVNEETFPSDVGVASFEAASGSPDVDFVVADKEKLPSLHTKHVTDLASSKRGSLASLLIECVSVKSKDCDVPGGNKDDIIAGKTKTVGKHDAEIVSMKNLTSKETKDGVSEEQADGIGKDPSVNDSGSEMAFKDGVSEEEDKDTEGKVEQTSSRLHMEGYIGGENTFVVSRNKRNNNLLVVTEDILLNDEKASFQEAENSVTEEKQENPKDGGEEEAVVEEGNITTESEAEDVHVKEDTSYMDEKQEEIPSHALLTVLKPVTYLEFPEERNDNWIETVEPEDDPLLENQQDGPFVAHPSHGGIRDLHVSVKNGNEWVDPAFRIRKDPLNERMEEGDVFLADEDKEYQKVKTRKGFNGNRKVDLRDTDVHNSLERRKRNKQLSATKKMTRTKQIQKITTVSSKSRLRQKGKAVSDLKKNERKLKKILVQKKPRSRFTLSGNKKGNIKIFKGKKEKNLAGEKKALKLKRKSVSNPSNLSPDVNESSVAVRKPMFFDPHLPNEWCRVLNQRQSGKTAGMWDVYIVNPEGRRFRSRVQLKAYLIENRINLDADLFNFNPYGSSHKLPSHKISHMKKSVGGGQHSTGRSGLVTGINSKKVVEEEENVETRRIGRSGRVIRSKFVVSELLGKSRKREPVPRQPTVEVKSSSENARAIAGDTEFSRAGHLKVKTRSRPRKMTPTKIIRFENVSEGENTANNSVVRRQGRPCKIVPSKIIRVTSLRNKVPVHKYPEVIHKRTVIKDVASDFSLEHSDTDSEDLSTKLTLRKRNRVVEETERQQNKLTKHDFVKYQQEDLPGISNDTSSVQSEREMRRLRRNKIVASDLFTSKKYKISPHTAESSNQCEAEAGTMKGVEEAEKIVPKVVLHRLPIEGTNHMPEEATFIENDRTRRSSVDTEGSPMKSRVTALAPPEEHSFYDENLPRGWCRRVLLYREGVSTGIWKVYFKSPDGTKFHSQQELQSYIKNNKLGIESGIFKFSVFAEDCSKVFASERDKLSKSQPQSQKMPNAKQFSPPAQQPGIIKPKMCSEADSVISTKRQRRVRFDLKEVLGKKKLDHVNRPAKIAELPVKQPLAVDAIKMQNCAQKKATVSSPEFMQNRSTIVSVCEAVTGNIIRTRRRSLGLGKRGEVALTPTQTPEQTAEINMGEQSQKLLTCRLEQPAAKVQMHRIMRYSLPATTERDTRISNLKGNRSEVPNPKMQLDENRPDILRKSLRLSSHAESPDTPPAGGGMPGGVGRRVSGYSTEQSNISSRVTGQSSRNKNRNTQVISKVVEDSIPLETKVSVKNEPALPTAGLQENRESRHLRQNRKRKFVLTELFRAKKKEVENIPVSVGTSKNSTKTSAGLNKSPQTKRARSASWPARRMGPMLIDPTLPKGWARVVKQRKSGVSAGMWNVYIYSPEGKRFRSKNELRAYLEEKNLGLDAESFDMSVSGKRYKGSEFQNGQ